MKRDVFRGEWVKILYYWDGSTKHIFVEMIGGMRCGEYGKGQPEWRTLSVLINKGIRIKTVITGREQIYFFARGLII